MHRRELCCCFIFHVGLSICNLETGITRIRGPPRPLPPFEGEHWEWMPTAIYLPQGQASRFTHGWLKIPGTCYDLVARCIENQALRRSLFVRVTIPALGGLTLEFPWDPGEGFGFKPPITKDYLIRF